MTKVKEGRGLAALEILQFSPYGIFFEVLLSEAGNDISRFFDYSKLTKPYQAHLNLTMALHGKRSDISFLILFLF